MQEQVGLLTIYNFNLPVAENPVNSFLI